VLTATALAMAATAAPVVPVAPPVTDLGAARAAQVEAARRYRASLEALLPLHEARGAVNLIDRRASPRVA
jgi:hypothetical protein